MKKVFLIFIVILGSSGNKIRNNKVKLKNELEKVSYWVNSTVKSKNKEFNLVNSIKNISKKDSIDIKNIVCQYFKKNKFECDSKELPKLCKSNNLEVKFLFNEKSNQIVINDNGKIVNYKLKYFFEGIDYIPYLFRKGKKRFLVLELIFEYGSKLIIFQNNERSDIFFIDSFLQDDLYDEKGNYIESDITIMELNNDYLIKIGNKKVFKIHNLDISKKIKL